ncbi:conjugal transfer protein TraB [Streptomyces sp. NPDC052069]|uniref:conjugal transfer protein TraB n=1 Tax=Streptomyces sp. NPDC052069 TaxID=3154650 RepID=UPI00342F63B8
MSELVPRPIHLPDRSERPTFLRLAARVTILAASALSLTEGLHRLKRQMEHDAKEAETRADQCDQAEVEPRFTGLIREAADALRDVAKASGELANRTDVLAMAAEDLADAHDREYRGVYEAVRSSSVQQAKPGFYRTR